MKFTDMLAYKHVIIFRPIQCTRCRDVTSYSIIPRNFSKQQKIISDSSDFSKW